MPDTFAAASTTLCEAFQTTVTRTPQAVAVRGLDGQDLTFGQWAERTRDLAAGFAALGARHGDTAALLMANRREFYPIDTAFQHLGVTPFSIYNTAAPDQITYLLSHSGARIVVCEAQYLPVLREAMRGTAVEHLVCIDDHPEGTLTLDQVAAAADPAFDFEMRWRAVRPEDTLTLIYTSGTTGAPKGVRVTHAGMIAMLDSTQQMLDSSPRDRLLSFLPSAHIADRWSGLYHLMVVGNQLTPVPGRGDLPAALTSIRPTIFGSVPQVWQKLAAALDARLGETTGIKAALADWAIRVGRQASDAQLDGRPIGPLLRIQHRAADIMVLSTLRTALGLDRTRLAVSGAAPISAELLRRFNGLGIPLTDGWGMSETSGIITLAPPGHIRPGTVGLPAPGVELAIAEDGEILTRGPFLMAGYLDNPEQTAQAIDLDGWLHTGDIGEIDPDGYLRIVDRKKELIINAGGKNMSPANIENWIKAFSPLIGQAVAIGDNRKYNVALIALDPDATPAYAEKHDLPTTPAALATDPHILDLVTSAIDRANAKLSRVEQIKKFRIVPDFWQPGTEVLTPTMKLRRKPIHDRYAELIETMYRA
ncbi:AMP-dependent synthetase/ligase [Nocardia tengchongensis]